jgi:predicted enzyme related to lactoylglutathione lyase
MKNKAINVVLVLAIILTSCTKQNDTHSPSQESHLNTNQIADNMKSFIAIFEIPTVEFSRAVKFYQSILDIEIHQIDMQGTQMGLFPSENQMVSGVLVKGEGYKPSGDGVVIYLNGGDNLQIILDKVEINGGTIILPKTLIDEENGHYAMFLDTEGNRIGLHSPN